jgi:mono/diheme cytochrome c family protein
MLSLLLAAAIGQCGARASYGYARQSYYAAPTYTYQAPAQTYYQAPAQQYYQQPAVNYSLVADYLRQETADKERAEQNAKLDVLIKLLAERAAPPVQQAPQPQFQTPYPSPQTPAKAPPVQYEAPLPTKQSPQFEAQYPSQQYPNMQQPPYGEKPTPASPPPTPSFEQSSWVPPPQAGGYGGFTGVAAMTSVFQRKCAQCHAGESEDGAGVKLLELDGQLARIDPYLNEIGPAVSGPTPRMPKRGQKLTPQELYAVLSGLQEYAATSRGRANVLASFGQ